MTNQIDELKILDKDGTYYYTTKGRFLRVTAITGIINKPGLMYFYGKEGTAGAKKIMKFASERGTRIHALCEAHIDGKLDLIIMTPDEKTIMENFKEITKDFEWLECETQVVNEEAGYIGQLDAIAEVDGKVVLVDFKTGSGIYPEYGLQLAAYREKRPKVQACLFMLLDKETLKWSFVDCNTDGLFDIFLAAKKVKEWEVTRREF